MTSAELLLRVPRRLNTFVARRRGGAFTLLCGGLQLVSRGLRLSIIASPPQPRASPARLPAAALSPRHDLCAGRVIYCPDPPRADGCPSPAVSPLHWRAARIANTPPARHLSTGKSSRFSAARCTAQTLSQLAAAARRRR